MNKQELIKKYKKLEGVWDAPGAETARQIFLQDLDQLDEPQPVEVPKFVADWIEECEEKEKTLLNSLLYTPEGVNSWVGNSDNQELFARAWIEGYEVEKEPKYTVKFKATNQYLCDDDGIGLHISPSFRSNFRKSDLEKLSLTEVFDSPLFEVEEVTERALR